MDIVYEKTRDQILEPLRGSFAKTKPLGIPLYSKEAIDFLEETVTSDFYVFEYGSGNSTIWFGERAKWVVSLEHSPDWHARVLRALSDLHIDSVNLLNFESLDTYTTFITLFPKYRVSFDLIAIDGRRRMKCMKNSRDSVKPGGYLLLDNANRWKYAKANKMMKGWERVSTSKRTMIWRKPDDS